MSKITQVMQSVSESVFKKLHAPSIFFDFSVSVFTNASHCVSSMKQKNRLNNYVPDAIRGKTSLYEVIVPCYDKKYGKSQEREKDDMGITIKEIAAKAGVHRSTVDKVLHNRPGVSSAVREKVQKIIDESNYQINPIGKALQMQSQRLRVKVILLEVDAKIYLKKGMDKALKDFGTFKVEAEYHTVVYPDIQNQARLLESCMEEQTDGIVLCPINAPEIAEKINQCAEKGIPVVTVNSDVKGSQRLCYIGQDGYKAGRVAGRLMGEFLRGEGKVAVFTSDGDDYQSFPFGTRENGFRQFMAGEYPNLELLPSIYTQEDARRIGQQTRVLCDREPELSGIFITCGGVQAVGNVLEEYRRQDIRLVCYENYPEILALMEKGIVTATLDSEIEAQGKESVEVLMNKLIYGKKPPRKHLYSNINILLKESL